MSPWPSGPLVVVGDALLDRDLEGTAHRVCPDAPVPVVDEPRSTTRPGGAALAAVLATGTPASTEVVLVTALGEDGAGDELRHLLADARVHVIDAGLAGRTPEKVRIRAGGQSVARLDHGGAPSAIGPLPDEARTALTAAAGVLVSDYGRGMADRADVRELLASLDRRIPVVWDPHPQGGAPVRGARLATPSDTEARQLTGSGVGLTGASQAAETLARRWGCAVAVTLGARGALVSNADGPPLVVPARPVAGDGCGAGDRFASSAAVALAAGAIVPEAVEVAVEHASAFVGRGSATAAGAPPAPGPTGDPVQYAASVQKGGGTVVAAGGCFDVLHTGHVRYLEAARRLGDALVVCLNSDESVRRLKGAGRPLLPATDRATMLRALSCVDAVLVFGGDTPVEALEALRPDVFAKGADYRGTDLPETDVLARWGGQVVVLPYVAGQSTSDLVDRMTRGASPSSVSPPTHAREEQP